MMRFALFLLLCAMVHGQETPASLAAHAALDQNFSSPELTYLLLDGNGQILDTQWPEGLQSLLSPGSLVKPWLALAYGEQHDSVFPHANCHGTADRCWLPRGHGTMTLTSALGYSCNAYFFALAPAVDRTRAIRTLERYGLRGPSETAPDEALVGLSSGWQETPLALARAFLQLSRERNQPLQKRILGGMADSARSGTARALGDALGAHAVLAKTGTARCAHHRQASGDGYTIALYPADQPRYVLLVRQHGSTGAVTAHTAARMLLALGASRTTEQAHYF